MRNTSLLAIMRVALAVVFSKIRPKAAIFPISRASLFAFPTAEQHAMALFFRSTHSSGLHLPMPPCLLISAVSGSGGDDISTADNEKKEYFVVPFEQNDKAKALGARWDKDKRQWFSYKDNPHYDELLDKFGPLSVVSGSGGDDLSTEDNIVSNENKEYLMVPFEQKDKAKTLGARWDEDKRQWFSYKDNPHYNELLDKFGPLSVVYLDVPFTEKDEAKALGAKWNGKVELWCTHRTNPNFDALMNQWHEVKYHEAPPLEDGPLPGEDRSFLGNGLFVDLIPRNCWFTNVRYCVTSTDWRRIRKLVIHRANNQCECCQVPDHLEVHERWSYKYPVQHLERLVCLCRECHEVTHMGLAQLRGRDRAAKNHLMKVTGMSQEEADDHIADAFSLWEERSSMGPWELDLSILVDAGIDVVRPVVAGDRASIADSELDKIRKRSD